MDTPPPPLPTLHATAAHGRWAGSSTVTGLRLDWGALRLRAGRVAGNAQEFDATDRVELVRGTESLHARRLHFVADGARFRAEDATVSTGLLQLRAKALERRAERIDFEELRLSPERTGGRELQVTARRGFYTYADDQMTVFDARFRLFGMDLVRTRKATFGISSFTGDDEHVLNLPVSARQSRISGLVTGLSFTFKPLARVTTVAVGERSERRGFQSLIRIRTHLLRARPAPPRFFGAAPPGAQTSPLRQLLSPPETGPVQSADAYSGILTLPKLLLEPRTPRRDLYATLTFQHNRELIRRDAEVMLTREPEFQIQGYGPVGRDGIVTVDFGVGDLTEVRIDNSRTHTSRRKGIVEIASPSVRAAGVRFQLQGLGSHFSYTDGQRYQVLEGRFVAERRLAERSGISVGWIERHAHGLTPLRSDRIETPSEAQVRLQTMAGGVIGAVGWRWDLRQSQLFDTEFGIALAGRIVEPRLTYRTQGHRLSLQLGFPRLSL